MNDVTKYHIGPISQPDLVTIGSDVVISHTDLLTVGAWHFMTCMYDWKVNWHILSLNSRKNSC